MIPTLPATPSEKQPVLFYVNFSKTNVSKQNLHNIENSMTSSLI